MKRVITLIFLLYFSISLIHGQLLENPSISVHDFEVALTNPDHLKDILSEHEFVFTPGINRKLITEQIKNPLFPDLEAVRSGFFWKNDSTLHGSDVIRRVSIYDWKAGHGPQPNVVRTIVIFLNKDSINSKEIDSFLKKIMFEYTKQVRRDNNSAPYFVFTKNDDPRIEVRTGKTWIEPGWVYTGYNVSFELTIKFKNHEKNNKKFDLPIANYGSSNVFIRQL